MKLLVEKAANLLGCTTIYLDVSFHQEYRHLWQMLHLYMWLHLGLFTISEWPTLIAKAREFR